MHIDDLSLQRTIAYYGRRFFHLVYIPIILLGIALLITSRETDRWNPMYSASATLMLSPAAAQSQLFPFALDSTSRDRIVQSYVAYLTLPSFAQLVQEKGGLSLSAEQIRQALTVEAIPDTFFLRLTAQSNDRFQAQQIANAAAKVLAQNALYQAPHDVEREELTARLQSQLSYYENQVLTLRKAVDEQQRKPLAQDPQERQNDIQLLAALRTQLTQTESLVVQLLTTLATLRAQGPSSGASVAIVDEAILPSPIPPPSRVRFWLFALVASQALGIGIVVLLDYLFPRFRTESHAANVLGLSLLGSIPVFKPRRAASKLISLERPNGPEAERFRLLATTLIRRLRTGNGPVLLQVTSAMQREGKSLIVSNLAAAMGELGHRVLVVDTDLRRPTQHGIFRRENAHGLAAVPPSDQPFDPDLIQSTEIAQVRLLNAGPQPSHPAHFLASAPLGRLLQELREGIVEVDVIIFDSPPLLPVSDAAILAPRMDAVLLVVDLQNTEQRNARRAQELLVGVGAPLIGLVINRASQAVSRHSYPVAYRS